MKEEAIKWWRNLSSSDIRKFIGKYYDQLDFCMETTDSDVLYMYEQEHKENSEQTENFDKSKSKFILTRFVIKVYNFYKRIIS